MGTCVGCGTALAPSWKFCIHCGLAVEHPEIPAAIRPDALSAQDRGSRSSRLVVLGGVGVFLIGVALLIVAIAFFAGAIR